MTNENESHIEIWVEDFLNELLEYAELDLWIDEMSLDQAGYLRIELGGADAGICIGRDGLGLEALQHLVVSAAIRRGHTDKRILLDIEGYRKRKEVRLKQDATQFANDVKQTGDPLDLQPMTAHERRIVHLAIAEMDGVTTESAGEGMNRYVQILPGRA